jgi:hypothetical protein
MGEKLSYDGVKQLLIRNGANPSWAPLLAGIAASESGYWTDKLNPVAPDYSVGLWQINYFKGNLPSGVYVDLLTPRSQAYGTPQELLADPNKQAKAAIQIWGPNAGGSWAWNNNLVKEKWSASGSYGPPDDATVRRWVTEVGFGDVLDTTQTLEGGGSGGGGGSRSGVMTIADSDEGCNKGSKGFSLSIPLTGGINGIGNACQLKALSGGLLVGVGVSLVIVGAVLVAMNTGAGKTAVNAASNLIPGGGLLKSIAGGSTPKLPRVTAATRAESRANYDARNPSPERQEATRKARSGNLGVTSYTMDDLADMF